MLNTLIIVIAILMFIIGIRLYQIHSLTKKLRRPFTPPSGGRGAIPSGGRGAIPSGGRGAAYSFGIVVLLVSGFFTFFANTIPQVEFHPPKKVEIASDLSGTELAKIGKQLFEGKGTCLVCHTINGDGLRAPDLAGIGERAGKRIDGYSSEDYLFESLFFPPKYVVKGYAPSMPPIHKPPAQLSIQEMTAVIAFLQSMGGEITITASTKPNFDKIGKPE